MIGINRLYIRCTIVVFFFLLISPFASATVAYAEVPQANDTLIDKTRDSEMKQLISEGIALLTKGSYEEASLNFSKALKFDPSKSWLHFLNGLSYHLRASAGNGSLYELAEQGYQLAIKFDGSNWMANYYLGLMYLDQRKFDHAQKKIAETLLVNAENAEIVYSMLYASYYAGDPQTAETMLGRLKILTPEDPRILKLSPLLSAALNKSEQAKAELDYYSTVAKSASDFRVLASRVSDWKRFYNSYQPTELNVGSEPHVTAAKQENVVPIGVQSDASIASPPAGPVSVLPDPPAISQSALPVIAPQPVGSLDEEMVSVDVVMISTEESVRTNSGVNLLNGLRLQYDGHYKRTLDYTSASGAANASNAVTNLFQSITIPSINYSLNIFNSQNERNEILARPTLTALNGLQSVFFSGTHLEAATVSTSTIPGDSVKISADVGVKLTIQPQLISRKKLKLNVTAERTFLKKPNDDIQYTSKVEMSKISVQANVIMDFGETLVLSGLSEKETQKSRDGVPFLQSIPIIQYLFSNKQQLDFHRSVLILITPRPRLNVYVKTAEEKDADAGNSGVINELQARYSDWFKPYPNTSSVFHHLQSNSLYREFRTGDVSMERWNTQQTLKDALRQAAEFLYY